MIFVAANDSTDVRTMPTLTMIDVEWRAKEVWINDAALVGMIHAPLTVIAQRKTASHLVIVHRLTWQTMRHSNNSKDS